MPRRVQDVDDITETTVLAVTTPVTTRLALLALPAATTVHALAVLSQFRKLLFTTRLTGTTWVSTFQ